MYPWSTESRHRVFLFVPFCSQGTSGLQSTASLHTQPHTCAVNVDQHVFFIHICQGQKETLAYSVFYSWRPQQRVTSHHSGGFVAGNASATGRLYFVSSCTSPRLWTWHKNSPQWSCEAFFQTFPFSKCTKARITDNGRPHISTVAWKSWSLCIDPPQTPCPYQTHN